MKYLLVLCCLAFAANSAFANERAKRALSVFSIVTFPNEACVGNNNKNGTCFTTSECEEAKGAAAGTCANGYGVCCTFTTSLCGQTFSVNNTYFTNPSTVPTGSSCHIDICKANDDICKLRLDFMSFTIAGPSTLTDAAFNIPGSGVAQATKTQCLEDSFIASCPGAQTPNVLCGQNDGEHMYIDASDACNRLNFQIGSGTTTTRTWNIKITQIACSDPLLPPEGCTQYYFGSTSGTIMNYNFAGGIHLANQNQNICFRREHTYCAVCFAAAAVGDFKVSGASMFKVGGTVTNCCGYGGTAATTNVKTFFDCVMVPSALQMDLVAPALNKDFCGSNMGFGTIDDTQGSVCTRRQPLSIRFVTDSGEASIATKEATLDQPGFKLNYELKMCT